MNILAIGDSMLPTLSDGNCYEIEETHDIELGDIIVYKVGKKNICHRVVKIIKSKNDMCFYETKGDNCEKPDEHIVVKKQIIGKVLI